MSSDHKQFRKKTALFPAGREKKWEWEDTQKEGDLKIELVNLGCL